MSVHPWHDVMLPADPRVWFPVFIEIPKGSKVRPSRPPVRPFQEAILAHRCKPSHRRGKNVARLLTRLWWSFVKKRFLQMG